MSQAGAMHQQRRQAPPNWRPLAWLALLAWLLLNAAPVISQCRYHADPATTFPGWCDGHSSSTPAQPRAGQGDSAAADAGGLCGYCDLLFHSPLAMVDFLIAALVIGEALARPLCGHWLAPPSPCSQYSQPRGPPRAAST